MTAIARKVFQLSAREVIRKTSWSRPQLRVGIIGAGVIAPEHVYSYEDRGIATVVGICDVQPAALGNVLRQSPSARGYLTVPQMLTEQKPEIVSICTWPQSHAKLVRMVADFGVKGILCEKPLALSQGEVEDMVEVCRDKGIKLAGGHQYRFHSNFMRAAEVVQSGQLGKVVSARGFIKSTLANNGPHLIDTTLFVLGDPSAISVRCRCIRNRNDFNRGYPAEDGADGEIDFGAYRLEIKTGDLSPEFFAIEVQGEQGSVRVTPKQVQICVASKTRHHGSDERFRARQFRQFLHWVQGKQTDYAAKAEVGLRSNELILALYESARTEQPVRLPLAEKGDVIHALYPTTGENPTPEAQNSSFVARTAEPGKQLALFGGPRSTLPWFSTAPSLGLSELKNLAMPLLTRRLCSTVGFVVKEFESEVASLYGVPAVVASTSGTAALHVGMAALDLNPGDEVITTPLTDMGTVIPILVSNCLPVFADVDPMTGNLTAETIAAKITPRTKAVILVHLFGRPADLRPILDLLQPRGIALIEDCSQAHYADYQGKKVGTFGDIGCFSLQQSKQITCGDGGYTRINRPDLARRAALFVDKGWDRTKSLRSHLFLGMNYRMTELQGAIALAQARKLPRLVAARRKAAEQLTRQLAELAGVIPPPVQDGVNPAWWTFPFSINEQKLAVGAAEFLGALQVEGVRVQGQYLPAPIFEYDMFKNQHTYGTSGFPFTAYSYQKPELKDFPGFTHFNRTQMFMWWSHRVKNRHLEKITRAVRKVADYYRTPG